MNNLATNLEDLPSYIEYLQDRVNKSWYDVKQGLSYEQLGKLLSDYIDATQDMSWEGYEPEDFDGIEDLFTDILVYRQNI